MDILLDETGDIALSPTGSLSLTSRGPQEVGQRIYITLGTFLGEWFWNTQFGQPYYQTILTKGVDKGIVDSIYAVALRGTRGVIDILQFESVLDNVNRVYSAAAIVRTESGDLTITIPDGSIDDGIVCVYNGPNGDEVIFNISTTPLEKIAVDESNWRFDCDDNGAQTGSKI